MAGSAKLKAVSSFSQEIAAPGTGAPLSVSPTEAGFMAAVKASVSLLRGRRKLPSATGWPSTLTPLTPT